MIEKLASGGGRTSELICEPHVKRALYHYATLPFTLAPKRSFNFHTLSEGAYSKEALIQARPVIKK